MPLLQFDWTLSPSAADREAVAASVTDHYTTEMATTAGHVAVTFRDRTPADLYLGRAVDGPLVFLDAEIRAGRPFERKRAFATATFEDLRDRFDVPRENLKVVFTEHEGANMMGYDRVGGEWTGGTDVEGAGGGE